MKFFKKKYLGLPILSFILAIVFGGVALAATTYSPVSKVQHINQSIVAPAAPAIGTISLSQDDITLPQSLTNFEFSQPEGTVTVTVVAPANLKITVDPGNYTEFGVQLVCTSGNAGSISGTYWNSSSHSIEVSTYQDLEYTICLSVPGTYTFSETIVGYTMGGAGTGSASITFNLSP